MATYSGVSESVDFSVENIGGIDSSKLSIPPGVTVLTGKNATNRTSFLQSIMAAVGSTQATLKGDADAGTARLEVDGETYERTLTRTGEEVSFSGECFLEDPDVADLFAFLLETNEARQAVARSDDLREIIMRPVNIDDIKQNVRELEDEKSNINDELARIESRKRNLSNLERKQSDIKDKIQEKKDKLGDFEVKIDTDSQYFEGKKSEKQELEKVLDKLRATRSDLESTRRQIDSQKESVASLKKEKRELESELEELPEESMGAHDTLESQVARLRTKRKELNTEISDLQSLIQYNEERLDAEDYDVFDTVGKNSRSSSSGSPTEALLADDENSVVCWTCGSRVDHDQIEATISRLQDLRQDRVQTLNEIKPELEELKKQQREAKQKQSRRETIEQSLSEISDELNQRNTQIETLKAQRDDLTQTIERLETEVDKLESEDFDEVLSLHKEANQLEFEIDSLESDLEDVTDEIETIETMLDRAENLREQRDELVEELTEERTKIDRIEANAIDAFNDHMDEILEILEYENLDRIWIERVEETVREGREKVVRTAFELHVVRTTEIGAAYEDTVDHLSESEREVTGLLFALAGYLVHDLHKKVPFMLLDSLEAIDSDRIAQLVDYFKGYADYLVVALLPEDAQAMDDSVTRITAI